MEVQSLEPRLRSSTHWVAQIIQSLGHVWLSCSLPVLLLFGREASLSPPPATLYLLLLLSVFFPLGESLPPPHSGFILSLYPLREIFPTFPIIVVFFSLRFCVPSNTFSFLYRAGHSLAYITNSHPSDYCLSKILTKKGTLPVLFTSFSPIPGTLFPISVYCSSV